MECVNSKLVQMGMKPITTKSVLFYYAPAKGAVCFCILGSQMLSPEMYAHFTILRSPPMTNVCLGASIVGCSLYMYNRPHMRTLQSTEKTIYSVMSSGLFNLGCVLGLALCRNAVEVETDVPASGSGVVMRALLGAMGAAAMLSLTRSYVQHLDTSLASNKSK